MSDDLPTGLQLLEIDPAFRANPYPRLADLQSRCPVRRDPVLEAVVLTGYEEVRAVINDAALWRDPSKARPRSRFGGDSKGEQPRPQSILIMDDPDHARIRGPLTQAFYKRAGRMRPRIEALVDGVLDGLAQRSSFDLIEDYGIPVPILVIAAVLGIDDSRMTEFREWSESVIQVLNPLRTPEEERDLFAGRNALAAFFTEAMAERRANPRDDLITDMVELQAAGAPLTDAEVRNNLQALLVAGNLTTTDLIGNGVLALLNHPDQLARLRAEPKRIAAAVEEILRWDPPVSATGRIASREMAVRGVTVGSGETFSAQLRAANRDPSVFPEPDRFDIARPHAPHVAFGGGAHICIGAPLARLEGQVAILKLIQRFPSLRLAEQNLVWRALPGFRGLERLIVET